MLGLAPFVLTWILVPLYLSLNTEVLHHHIIPFIFFIGLLNALSVGQIIIAHLIKAPFPYLNILIAPLAFAVVDSLGPLFQKYLGVGWPTALGQDQYQVAFVFLCLGMALGVYGAFVVDVIRAICDYLDIWCLTIKHPWTAEDEEREAKKAK
jgi:ethanolaminephosphotransferase